MRQPQACRARRPKFSHAGLSKWRRGLPAESRRETAARARGGAGHPIDGDSGVPRQRARHRGGERAVPQQFTYRVPDDDIADLRGALRRTRLPDAAPGEPWAYGTSVDYVRGLVDYWRDGFDWRAQEARLNAFPQFRIAAADSDLHYLHVPGKGPTPMPLLLMHGWPGSVFEFLDIIPRLTDPARFGGDPADAFTVVAPSLPGYGLSFRPGQTRFGVEEIADILADLMSDDARLRALRRAGRRLGRHARRGWARSTPTGCGLHVNMLFVRRDPSAVATRRPRSALRRRLAHWLNEETGYQWIQGTKPQTLSFALTDSPAGLAAWIVEKFRAWSDCGGDVESALTRDRMLAKSASTGSPARSARRSIPITSASRRVADPGRRRHGADRLCRVPKGNPPAAALARGEDLHRYPPLDGDAAGRAFRRDGAAGGAGRGRAGVLPGVEAVGAVGGRGGAASLRSRA